jgi:hypothetical protein
MQRTALRAAETLMRFGQEWWPMSSGAKYLIVMLAMPFVGCVTGSIIGASVGNFKAGGFWGLVIGCAVSIIGQRSFFSSGRKGVLGFLNRAVPRQLTDRILAPHQVMELISDDYGNFSEAVIFVAEQSKPILPSETFLLPFLTAEFAEDAHLGMIYGTGSGCALIRKTALQKAQAMVREGRIVISNCQDLMVALASQGYSAKKDPKLSLDLLD